MRKQLLLTGLAAGLIIFDASSAAAQFRTRMGSSPNAADQPMKLDPNQFTPEGQMGRNLLEGMSQLMKQNQELKAQLDATKAQLDEIQLRLHSISTVLTTGTGEGIGSMVHKIRDKVGASD